MRHVLIVLMLCLSAIVVAQNTQSPDQIRQRMAEIRRTTNWDDPAAAAKANAEIKKLAGELNGGQLPVNIGSGTGQAQDTGKPATVSVKSSDVTEKRVVAIAGRFFDRSYKALDAVSKAQFDLDLKAAKDDGFSLEAVRSLTTSGGLKLTFGTDHHIACVYLAAAARAFPTDTLSINNFGAYLRNIDSVAVSLPVLLYANQLFSASPIILTQLGNSYFELNDLAKAESYYKEALKINPDFSQAHTSLCDLYIKQNRLKDAILELFAGVKGMGASYGQLSSNFQAIQSQAENSPGGESELEKFWGETRNQMNPPDALAPLERTVERIRMPSFTNCTKFSDWTEGGGFGYAVEAYTKFHNTLMQFSDEFLGVQYEVPDLPPNAVLRDYPNERFALDCLTEYFFKESQDAADAFSVLEEWTREKVSEEADAYFSNREAYTNEFIKCAEGCASDARCIEECHRVYCTKECPAANIFNDKLQSYWDGYLDDFNETVDRQKEILDDLYEFTAQWYAKIESPYWSRICAYEIQRVALSVIGNAYSAYTMAFIFPAHNDCGTDCSVYANPFFYPPEEVRKKTPEPMPCPDIVKGKISIGPCDLGLDCESIEFGCAAGVAASLKRNFVKKTTTGFVGVGAKTGAGFIGAGFKAGFEVTVTDNNEVKDAGAKFDASASFGPGVTKGGVSTSGSYSLMTGLSSAKTGFSVGGKAK